MTKKFEEHIGDNICKVINFFEKREIIGEITLVIKGISSNKNRDVDMSNLKFELNELISAGLSLSAASKYLAYLHHLLEQSTFLI